MPSVLTRRSLVGMILFGFCGSLAGCGSATPPDGTQINTTIPKAEAEKQNKAYEQYAKERISKKRKG